MSRAYLTQDELQQAEEQLNEIASPEDAATWREEWAGRLINNSRKHMDTLYRVGEWYKVSDSVNADWVELKKILDESRPPKSIGSAPLSREELDDEIADLIKEPHSSKTRTWYASLVYGPESPTATAFKPFEWNPADKPRPAFTLERSLVISGVPYATNRERIVFPPSPSGVRIVGVKMYDSPMTPTWSISTEIHTSVPKSELDPYVFEPGKLIVRP